MTQRPIKLDIYDTESGQFAPLVYLTERNPSYNSDLLMLVGQYPERFKVRQSTGLHDKNGKEIWEGDVVKWKSREQFDEVEIEHITYVEFSKAHAGWKPMVMDTECEDGFYSYRVGEIEVIGNIYENPELLKS